MKVITESTDIIPSYDLSNISPLREILMFDIETTGLKKEATQIYLIGVGFFDCSGRLTIRQWLAQSAADEKNILKAFLEFAVGFKTLLHFNGDTFDIPYTRYKAELYELDFCLDKMNGVDIYKTIKPCKNFLSLSHMNQTSIEDFLGITRRDKMNGGLLIPYYYRYELSLDRECEDLLLLHNNDDIRGMAKIACILSFSDILEGRFSYADSEIYKGRLILRYRLCSAVPVRVDRGDEDAAVAAEDDLLTISLNIRNETAKIPIKNVNDYYYLPAEDMIIHKDLAEFVGKQFKKKANKSNCFLKRDGMYIPSFGIECVQSDGLFANHAEQIANSTKGGIIEDGIYILPDRQGKPEKYLDVNALLNEKSDFLCAYAKRMIRSLKGDLAMKQSRKTHI